MSDKVVIVSSSSGMGLATAHRFRAEGYDVVISARRRERIEAALAEIDGGAGYQLDYAEPDTI